MLVLLLVWFTGYKLLFDFRDAQRHTRSAKRASVLKSIASARNKKELVKLGSQIRINATGNDIPMLRKARNLNLGFRNLTVDLFDGKHTKRIVDNVSGDIRAGRLTAIMGPSGAGKSSFLHVIGGRLRQLGQSQKAVNIAGAVLINGERRR